MAEIIGYDGELEFLTKRNVSFMAGKLEHNLEFLNSHFGIMGYKVKIEDGMVFLVTKNKTVKLEGNPDALQLSAEVGKKEVVISYNDTDDEHFPYGIGDGTYQFKIKESVPFSLGDSKDDKRRSSMSASYVFARNNVHKSGKVTLFNPRKLDGNRHHSCVYVYESGLNSWKMSMYDNSDFFKTNDQSSRIVTCQTSDSNKLSSIQLTTIEKGHPARDFQLTKRNGLWYANYEWTTFNPISTGETINVSGEIREYVHRLTRYSVFVDTMEGISLIKKHLPGQIEAFSKQGFLKPDPQYVKQITY